mmetsp:Transcript_26093/g.55059  ORF Transcript_26093/g.55059 Transcript_26093/m.55059 type:complete len:206 (+) Transcript_26093:48-665(+)
MMVVEPEYRNQMTTMINKIKIRLRVRGRKSQEPVDDDWLQPPAMSEDIFLRNRISPKSSVMSDDGSPAPSIDSSCHSSECLDNQDDHEEDKVKVMRVFISDGLEPGQEVKVHDPSGKTTRTCIPPRSEWCSKNCNGEPRSYFLLTQMMDSEGNKVSNRVKDENCSAKSMVNALGKVKDHCLCSPSLRVFDSTCPYHNAGVHHNEA